MRIQKTERIDTDTLRFFANILCNKGIDLRLLDKLEFGEGSTCLSLWERWPTKWAGEGVFPLSHALWACQLSQRESQGMQQRFRQIQV